MHVLHVAPYTFRKHFCFHVRNNTSQIGVYLEVLVCGKIVLAF